MFDMAVGHRVKTIGRKRLSHTCPPSFHGVVHFIAVLCKLCAMCSHYVRPSPYRVTCDFLSLTDPSHEVDSR